MIYKKEVNQTSYKVWEFANKPIHPRMVAPRSEACYTAAMKLGTGKILEIRQVSKDSRQAVISLTGTAPPAAGQYLQVHRPIDRHQPVGVTIFPGDLDDNRRHSNQFLTAPGIPNSWQPGDLLDIRGPLGKGFSLPAQTNRLALCAFGDSTDHLLPLAIEVLASGGEVAMFTEGDFSHLPARIEINQLDDLPDAFRWADLTACAVPLEEIHSGLEHLHSHSPLTCPTQVLIYGQFPCNAIAECGICAYRTKKGQTVTVCQDGPVFDWQQIS
jgi:NAD(P)H-flavin reductase